MEEKVSFSVSAAEPIAWHNASIKVVLDPDLQDVIIGISTQGDSSLTTVMQAYGPLKEIYYGSDEGNRLGTF